jgi:hypothetical protein
MHFGLSAQRHDLSALRSALCTMRPTLSDLSASSAAGGITITSFIFLHREATHDF